MPGLTQGNRVSAGVKPPQTLPGEMPLFVRVRLLSFLSVRQAVILAVRLTVRNSAGWWASFNPHPGLLPPSGSSHQRAIDLRALITAGSRAYFHPHGCRTATWELPLLFASYTLVDNIYLHIIAADTT